MAGLKEKGAEAPKKGRVNQEETAPSNNTIHAPHPFHFQSLVFLFFLIFLLSPAPVLTFLPFLGYLCQKHNITMEITQALLLGRLGFKFHSRPSGTSSGTYLDKLNSEMLFPS